MTLINHNKKSNYTPASEVSRDEANLTEIKNPHTLVYVCML